MSKRGRGCSICSGRASSICRARRLRCVDLSDRIIINALFDMSNLQAVDTDLITLSTDVNGEKLVVPFQNLEWSFIRLLQRFADRVVSDEDVRALKQILGGRTWPLVELE